MKHLYEYAVIRFVPDIEREEFINIGIVMMCKRRRWLRAAMNVAESKVRALASDWDMEMLHNQLRSFSGIVAGYAAYGPIAGLEPEERFRWLTAVKSACIQTSRPHPGLTEDLDAAFNEIFGSMVGGEPAQ